MAVQLSGAKATTVHRHSAVEQERVHLEAQEATQGPISSGESTFSGDDGAPMDTTAHGDGEPPSLGDMTGEVVAAAVAHVRGHGKFCGDYAAADKAGQVDTQLAREWSGDGALPGPSKLTDEKFGALANAATSFLRRHVKDEPRRGGGAAAAEAAAGDGKGPNGDQADQGDDDDESGGLVVAVAAVAVLLVYLLISGDVGVVLTLWLPGGWVKLHGGHCEHPRPSPRFFARSRPHKPPFPSQTTCTFTSCWASRTRGRRARRSRRGSQEAWTRWACRCSGTKDPRPAASGASRRPFCVLRAFQITV